MEVDIYTDISYCPVLKVAAFAYCIISEGLMVERYGMLEGDLNGPIIAETFCMADALCDLERLNLRGKLKVRVVSDCLNAIHHFVNDVKNKNANFEMKTAVDFVKETTHRLGWDVTFLHIRSHTGHVGQDYNKNRWCDRKAKEVLNAHRRKEKRLC